MSYSRTRNEYTDTVRDVKALVRREVQDEQKRTELTDNMDRMFAQLERQREQLTNLAVLTERVEGLTWLVRGVIVTTALEIVVAAVVFLITHHAA